MRLIFANGDEERVWKFLQTFDYPYPWTESELEQAAILAVLDDEDKPVGYVWGHFGNMRPPKKTMLFNVCIHPDFRSRWLKKRTLIDLFTVARLCGGDLLYTRPINDKVRNYLTRLDFKPDGEWMYAKIT